MSDHLDFTLGLQYGGEVGADEAYLGDYVFRTASLMGGLGYRVR